MVKFEAEDKTKLHNLFRLQAQADGNILPQIRRFKP